MNITGPLASPETAYNPSPSGYRQFLGLQAVAAAVQVQEQQGKEIWEDEPAMQYIRTQEHPLPKLQHLPEPAKQLACRTMPC